MSESRGPGRKFILVVLAFVVFTMLLLVGKIDQGAYVTLTMFVLGGYLTANVAQKVGTKEKAAAQPGVLP